MEEKSGIGRWIIIVIIIAVVIYVLISSGILGDLNIQFPKIKFS